jgi:general secretion pathway protein G
MIARTTSRLQRQARHAFTLMEMLVVVAIIVVLAGLGGFYLMPRLDETKEKTAYLNAKTLSNAAEAYNLSVGDYPPNIQALAQPQPNGNKPLVEPDAIKDPWGKDYILDTSTAANGKVRVYTTTPNGKMIDNFTKP